LSLTTAFTLGLLTLLITGAGWESIGVSATVAVALTWLALTVTAYALVVRTLPDDGRPAAGLLVLRLFGRRPAASVLLDDIAGHWRYFGPVRLIAGADLAGFTIDFHGLVKLLTFRLQHLFLVDADARAASPIDREGRFPVVDVFCFESAWMRRVDALIASSAIILLDVRGFDGQSRPGAGLSQEIGLLVRHDALSRTVALVDRNTSSEVVKRLIVGEGGHCDSLTRIDASTRGAASACLERLLSVSRVSGTTG
jgi:hypothetical protein